MLSVKRLLLTIIILLIGIICGGIYICKTKVVYTYVPHMYQFNIEDSCTISLFTESGQKYLGIVNVCNSPLYDTLLKDNE